MLWEKKNLKNPNQRGYLYLRETIYVRDKRTHKRKPKKLGDGTGHKNRGQYSKKKDIYCGKIVEKPLKKFINFQEFIENSNQDYLEYKLNSNFTQIIDDFISYLIHIHEIDLIEFTEKKISYELANGFLSKPVIAYLKRFIIRSGYDEKKEIERFAIRCEDSGIFDKEIIVTLFLKISPETTADVKQELETLKETKLQTGEYLNMKSFIGKNHD